jgi:FtsP/CotA-like multicopper oxidase with cupredoxin domain
MAITNRSILFIFITLVILSGFQSAGATTLSQTVFNVVDTNPDPNIFEAALSAAEQDVDINGTAVHAMIYKDANNLGTYAGTPNGIPIPQIVVEVGDEVVVTLTNDIPMGCAAVACDSSIHWHGIELDNDSDGTGVTQNHLSQGETYTYRFIVPRPGVFWFHTHMLPGPQTFAGMYGALIVKDPNEATLQGNGTIPPASNTHTVVLSDIEFNGGGDVGYTYDDDNDATTAEVFANWASVKDDCAGGNQIACKAASNGETVLVNGQNPGAGIPTITAKSGAGIRLRLINTSTNRYFRLGVTNNGTDNNFYRIGGEGGFLEQVRREGGTLGTWDTKFVKGEILVTASGRSDVVIVPTGNNGDIITISSLDYTARGGPPTNGLPAGDLLQIVIDNTLVDTPFTIAEGQDVMGAGGVENIRGLPINTYSDPTLVSDSNPNAGHGSADPIIRLNAVGAGKTAIDSVVGHFEDSGPDYTLVPYQDATRYAKVGDVLELTIRNETGQHHPFHHHGFSFQPVRVIKNLDDSVLYEFDYDEFIDVIDVFAGQSIVIRIKVDDRPRITDNRQEIGAPTPGDFFPTGGSEGRWVFHCHLFLHSAVGMVSELVILPNNPYANDVILNLPGTGVSILSNDNSSSTVLHSDTATAIAVGDIDNNGEDDVIVSFPAGTGPDLNGGTYISRNQGVLVSLDVRTAELIASGNFDGIDGDDLLLDFGIDGLSSYMNDTVVSAPLTTESPLAMAVGDMDNSGADDVVLSFTAFGTVLVPNFDLGAVSILDPTPAEVLELGDIDGNEEDDIVASFAVGNGPGATGGIFVARNQGALSLLTTFPAELLTSGDYDDSGQDDLVADLGSTMGLWVYLNDATTQQLTPLSPEAMSTGDVDSNGSDDMVFSFTGNGTFVFKDMTTLETLDPVGVAKHLAIGNVDGN